MIAEATIDQVERRIPYWINKYFDGDSQKANKLIPSIIEADPTTKGKYSEWLIKQWKDGTARFPDDTEIIAKNLRLFDSKKSKLEDKDISNYAPASLARTLDKQFGLTKSERKQARKGQLQLPPGAELVIEDGDYQVVEITTPEASSLLCSGTQWCVANKDTAENYLERGPLYLIYVGGRREFLVSLENGEFMDVYNDVVSNDLKFRLIDLLGPVTGRSIRNDPKFAYWYARDVIGGRWPEGEPAIAQNPNVAYLYALDVIKGRWPEAETVIAKVGFPAPEDSRAAYFYARDVIKGRWPEGEPAITKDAVYANLYTKNVIKTT